MNIFENILTDQWWLDTYRFIINNYSISITILLAILKGVAYYSPKIRNNKISELVKFIFTTVTSKTKR